MKSSVALSLKLALSRMVIGMTVVSFATSAPELIVSIQAALTGLQILFLARLIIEFLSWTPIVHLENFPRNRRL